MYFERANVMDLSRSPVMSCITLQLLLGTKSVCVQATYVYVCVCFTFLLACELLGDGALFCTSVCVR